ncbi:MAG: GTP 3',8-cyclase MoaA [Candidatus Nezhaarchaeota archaeon]|nr:GTP 3',8-cyclase MoaA [Candidatus Nezhaarchaeota archaeon]
MIFDKYGRPITNLRITITHKCNYRCFYCHREGEDCSDALTVEDVVRLVKVGKKLGMDKVKLTGGEPLTRSDLIDMIEAINEIGLSEVAMTTNGSLLKGIAHHLAKAGLSRVNVSLPSLREGVFERITGVQVLGKVMEGLLEAKACGLEPIKLNVVVLRGLNDDELWNIVDFARKHEFIVQLIELEPININDEFYRIHHVSLEEVELWLQQRAVRIEERKLMHNRRQYDLGDVKVEVVRPVNNPEFCMHCTRLRVTADGKLKPCIMRNDNLVDVLRALRIGLDDSELIKIFMKAVELREPYFKGACNAQAHGKAKVC